MKSKKIKKTYPADVHIRVEDPIASFLMEDALNQKRSVPNLILFLLTVHYSEDPRHAK